MKHISFFIERINSTYKKEEVFLNGIIIVIKKITNIDIVAKDISYTKGVIKLNLDPIARSVFLEKKYDLKKELEVFVGHTLNNFI